MAKDPISLDKLFRDARKQDEVLVTLINAAIKAKPRALMQFLTRQDTFERVILRLADQAVDSAVGKATDWAMDTLKDSVFSDVSDDVVDTDLDLAAPLDPLGDLTSAQIKIGKAIDRIGARFPIPAPLKRMALQEYASAQAFVREQGKKIAARAVAKATLMGAEQLRAIGKDAARKLYEAAAAQAIEKTKALSMTAVSSFQRGVVQRATAARGAPTDSERYWVYVGPEDRITRPFCESLAGKAIPDRLLDQLANGQGLPVRRFCGGYNCRHALIPVSERYVAANGLEEISTSDVRKINAIARSR